jgi:hypothetical protein
MAACAVLLVPGPARAQCGQIEVGAWLSGEWQPGQNPASHNYEFGTRVAAEPDGGRWILTCPDGDELPYHTQWLKSVTERDANGNPTEWMLHSDILPEMTGHRNGTWVVVCQLYHPPVPAGKGTPAQDSWWETIASGTVTVVNLAVSSVDAAAGAPPPYAYGTALEVEYDEPFVSLKIARPWPPQTSVAPETEYPLLLSFDLAEGHEVPEQTIASTDVCLMPVYAPGQAEAIIPPPWSAVVPGSVSGSVGIRQAQEGLYALNLYPTQVGPDGTALLGGFLTTVSQLTAYAWTGPRQAQFTAQLRVEGSGDITDHKHRWCLPDGTLVDAGGAPPPAPGVTVETTLPSRAFEVAGTYAFAAAYRDYHYRNYHEGVNKWGMPNRDKFTVPGCAHMTGCDWRMESGEILVLPPRAEATECAMEGWDALDEVLPVAGQEDWGQFYSGGGATRGVRGDVLQSQFVAACMDPLNEVVQFAGHGSTGTLMFSGTGPAYDSLSATDVTNMGTNHLRLLVLNCCETLGGDDSTSVGRRFSQMGTDAVVGYTGEVKFSVLPYMNETLWFHLTKEGDNVAVAVLKTLADGEVHFGTQVFTEKGACTLTCYPALAPTCLWPAFRR